MAARARGSTLVPAFAVLAAVTGTISLAVVAWETCGFGECPAVSRLIAYQPGRVPVLLDRNGAPLAELSRSQRAPVPLSALPPYLPAAFVAANDRRFYLHRGVDWQHVASLLLPRPSTSSSRPHGTISMQLARDVFRDDRTPERGSLPRLIREMRAAQEIERRYSKDEILELYINTVHFGRGVTGIEAAARGYFGTPATELNLAQAALLAAIVRSALPDPGRDPSDVSAERNRVLDLMVSDGWVTAADAEAAKRAPVAITAPDREWREPLFAPYFVAHVRAELERRFGDGIYDEPVRVWTTLDSNVQTIASEELDGQLRAIENGVAGTFPGRRYSARVSSADATPYLQGSVVVLDPRSGDVLAWVGGRDFAHSPFDRVERAQRQAGSAFAPFVYAAALERGFTLAQRVRDEPLQVELEGGRVWEAHNVDEQYDGLIALREALAESKDAATAQLAAAIGYDAAVDVARRAGIDEPLREALPTVLGAVTVSPLELTAAYTVFAGLGRRVEPRVVLRVERLDGTPIWAADAESTLALDPNVAFLMNDILHEEVSRLRGAAALDPRLRGRAAGRSGSTRSAADAWFIGYLPDLVAGVWIGFDRPQAISSHATGAQLAAPVWTRMTTRMYGARPLPEPWPRPHAIVVRSVDAATGIALAPHCRWPARRVRAEYFIDGTEPTPQCPSSPQGPSGAGAVVVAASAPPHGQERPPAQLAPALPPRQHAVVAGAQPTRASQPERASGMPTATTGQPPAGELAAAAPQRGRNVSGEWELVNEITETSYSPYRGLRLGFRVRLWQDGERVRGVGEKWSENDRLLAPTQRTPLHLDGTIDDASLTLLFKEQGRRRATSGILRMRLAESNDRLTGSFASTAAETSGTTIARRLD